jgi:poly(A)-specific ribonuclease
MEVDRTVFNRQLLDILQNIANADYVTFDLEMSGITTGRDRSRDTSKPTLQQQFEEMKEAAETFQVVQVGICCVEKVWEKGYYLARPYNFYLSPLELHGVNLNMDRRFSFSSSACSFLMKNSFDFGKVFDSGIPYLSRREQLDLKKQLEKYSVKNIPDIALKPGSPELTFYRRARSIIDPWVQEWTKKPRKSVCMLIV